MSELERNITNRLRDAESTGRVNPDALWDSIEERIDNTPPPTSGFSWKNAWFGLLLLFPFFGLWYGLSPTEQVPVPEEQAFATFEREVFEGAKNAQNRQLNYELCFPDSEVLKVTIPAILAKADPSPNLPPRLDEQKVLLAHSTPPQVVVNDLPAITKVSSPSQEELSVKIAEGLVNNQGLAGMEGSVATLSPKPLPPLPQDFKFLPTQLPIPTLEGIRLDESIQKAPFKKQSNQLFSVGGFVGLNTVRSRFKPSGNSDASNERAALLNDGYQLELGVSVAMELNYQPSERLLFSTGLNFDRFSEEFNYRSDTDTILLVTDGQDTSRLNAISTRIIRHHNKQQSITIPLLVGLQFGKGKFQYGAQAGIGLNLILSQKGRLLDAEGKLVSYDQRNQDAALLPRAKVGLSYLLQPFAAYRLSDQLSLTTRARMSYTNYGERPLFDLKMESWAVGFDLGMRWRF